MTIEIKTNQVKELRDRTGISIMQCRKALEEAAGDMEKAIIILQKQSKGIAVKKAERTLGSGVISSYIHGAGTVGVMVELMCETDFVAKNEAFKALAYDIAMHIAATNPEYLKKEDINAEARAKVAEVLADEVKDKPENMREKILEGKLNAYFAERILLDQPFVKDQNVTISAMIESAIQKFGERIEVGRFARFSTAR
jgi:elongation factor Ts